jgi:hypothetical protein
MNPNLSQQDSRTSGNETAQRIANNAIENMDAETKAFVKEFQQRWGAHYAQLADLRRKKIAELAGQSYYDVSLLEPTGKKVFNPLTEKEEDEYEDSAKPRRFNRKKVNQKNWSLLEQMKAKYANEEDPEERARLYDKMYQGMAFLYLGMSPDEYARTDWEEISLILQACVERSRHGLPNFQKQSSVSSTKVGVT